ARPRGADEADVRASGEGGAAPQRPSPLAQRVGIPEGGRRDLDDGMRQAGTAQLDIGAVLALGLAVQIDDVAQGRRERKVSPAPIPAARRDDLAAAFRRAGFLSMEPLLEATPRAGAWNAARISALVDGRAATVEVRNAPEPEAFLALREQLETFGQNELGLWGFAFSREELMARAEEAVEQARRLRDEREVDRGNLAGAVGRYRAAKDYMESLNPKPELYDEAVRGLAEAESELTAVVERLNWDVDHATQTKEWARAAQSLRELLEYVPDRSDPRHADAERRLFDAEKRIAK
ncbi:MAG: hypothetical protein II839_06725, partial [Kiritimatiellae bacterium]|nr:hypothetical protein [Kiritimatiellia bacterium]